MDTAELVAVGMAGASGLIVGAAVTGLVWVKRVKRAALFLLDNFEDLYDEDLELYGFDDDPYYAYGRGLLRSVARFIDTMRVTEFRL